MGWDYGRSNGVGLGKANLHENILKMIQLQLPNQANLVLDNLKEQNWNNVMEVRKRYQRNGVYLYCLEKVRQAFGQVLNEDQQAKIRTAEKFFDKHYYLVIQLKIHGQIYTNYSQNYTHQMYQEDCAETYYAMLQKTVLGCLGGTKL